jgi:hypothetical protein
MMIWRFLGVVVVAEAPISLESLSLVTIKRRFELLLVAADADAQEAIVVLMRGIPFADLLVLQFRYGA